ncbi:MAG: NAD(P)/FAD-dependent oxidoreductase, partial [bacterium]
TRLLVTDSTHCLMKNCDVAIIGGGLLGSAFGWGLAVRGCKTVMFDEGDNAIRTARGNFGLVWVQGKGRGMAVYARWSLEASMLWADFAHRLLEETGIDTHYHRPGGYNICLDEKEMTENREHLEQLRREALKGEYEYDIIDAGQIKSHLPMVGDVAGASYCPHDGHCNPLKLLRALHEGYLGHNGVYRPLTQIKKIESTAGEFSLISDAGDCVGRAEKIIISAGHGSAALGEQVGLDIPIHPDQGQVLVTERVSPLLDVPTNYVRQTDEGSFLLGPSSRDVGFDLSTEPGTLKEIAVRCVQAFPFLSKLRLQRAWAALRVMTPDGFPVYQHSDSHPGAFSFNCHSGVTLAANHALVVPQWIVDGKIPDDWNSFHPDRFDV